MKLLQKGIKFNLGSGKICQNNNLLFLSNLEKISKNINIKTNIYPIHTIKLYHDNKKLSSTPLFYFSTSQKNSHSQQQQPNPKTDFGLTNLKQTFQTSLNKYNLKGILKMYQILTSNNIKLSQSSLQQFNHRLNQQIDRLDHQSLNTILFLLNKIGQKFQLKGKNKLLRGINLTLQKNKIKLQHAQVYKTIHLLKQLNFPAFTLSKFLYSLVKQNQIEHRILYHLVNGHILKITLICLEMKQVDLEIKKRFIENLIKVKPKNVMELVYFYTILKATREQLENTVRYESEKKSVYNLAFNPYNYIQAQDTQTQSTKNQSTQTNNQTSSQPTPKTSSTNPINQQILQKLLQQKQAIIQQTVQKLSLPKLSQQILQKLKQILTDLSSKQNLQLSFKQIKQINLMLIANKFYEQSKEKANKIEELTKYLIEEGLKEKKQSIDRSKLIKVNQFIIFVQQLAQNGNTNVKQLQKYFLGYHNLYSQFMNLQQKLIFSYHKSKLLKLPISFEQLKQIIQNIPYSLNVSQFAWLNKVINLNPTNNRTQKDKQLVKQIILMVERKIDQEMVEINKENELRKQREKQERNEKQKQKQKVNDKSQQKQKEGKSQ